MNRTLFGRAAQGSGPAIFPGEPPASSAALAANPYRQVPIKELARRLDLYASLPPLAREQARSLWPHLDDVLLLQQV